MLVTTFSDTVVSWNMGMRSPVEHGVAKARLGVLSALVEHEKPSLLALQEAPQRDAVVEAVGGRLQVLDPTGGCLVAIDSSRWQLLDAEPHDHRVAHAHLRTREGSSIRFFCVHVPVLKLDEPGRADWVQRHLARRVWDLEEEALDHLVVAGDFNLPPYHLGVMGHLRASRAIQGLTNHITRQRRFMFNPSWKILANPECPGTFYRTSTTGSTDGTPWYAPDQLLVSATLARPLPDFHVVKHIGVVQLAHSKNNAPNKGVGSDHFPLLLRFRVPLPGESQ